MIFFKIIQNNEVTNVGFTFLKWNSVKNKMYVCNIDEAQFVQSSFNEKIYRDSWLKRIPPGVNRYEDALIQEVSEQEYNDLYKELNKEQQ